MVRPWVYDFLFLTYRAQTKYQIVLTKTDTVFPIDVARRAMQIEEVNCAQNPLTCIFFYNYSLSDESKSGTHTHYLIMQTLKANKSAVQPVVWRNYDSYSLSFDIWQLLLPNQSWLVPDQCTCHECIGYNVIQHDLFWQKPKTALAIVQVSSTLYIFIMYVNNLSLVFAADDGKLKIWSWY